MFEWRSALPAEEVEVYRRAGFGNHVGFGVKPGLLVVDVQYRTLGDEAAPLDQALDMYPTACGSAGWAAVEQIAKLISAFRGAGAPVFYAIVAPKSVADAGRFGQINPKIASVGAKGYKIPPEVAPQGDEIVLPKRHASAFFGTPLSSHVIDHGLDTLVVAGATTSGCVRASVVDAFSYNLHAIVPGDAVYDRSRTSHLVSLFEMDQKYADVTTSDAVVERLAGVLAAG